MGTHVESLSFPNDSSLDKYGQIISKRCSQWHYKIWGCLNSNNNFWDADKSPLDFMFLDLLTALKGVACEFFHILWSVYVWVKNKEAKGWQDICISKMACRFPPMKVEDKLSTTKRCQLSVSHMWHMTGPQQEGGWLLSRKVWPQGGMILFFICTVFYLNESSWYPTQTNPAIVQRHQNSNIWLSSEIFAWHKMKQRRLEVGSEESCQRHSQHHTCSFSNYDQDLPILGNLNSKGCSASNGTSAASCISLTSDRVTNVSYWSFTPRKPQT